ncbi:hypothetical protein ACYSNX_12620 [Myroides sp. LJL115]
MLKNINWARVGIVICTIIFLITAVTFEIFELGSLPAQFFGTLLGVVITAIITVLLLQGQTKSELFRERNLRVFIKKQKVFFQFLTQLNIILQKENLQIGLSHNKSIEREVLNLQDLLFEFGYLQMHTSYETYDQILDYVGNLLEHSKNLKCLAHRNEKDLELYYDNISEDFFQIVSLLKSELYSQAPTTIDKEKLNRIINLSFYVRDQEKS